MTTHVAQPMVGDHTILGPQNFPIHVRTYGSPQAKQCVVLLHGLCQALQCWRRQVPLAQDCYLVEIDLPYHGESNPSPAGFVLDAEVFAQSIRAVLSHLDILERPHAFICWSWGGLQLRNYLLKYGFEGVNGVISVASLLGGWERALPFFLENEQAAALVEELAGFPQLSTVNNFVHLLTKQELSAEEMYLTKGYNFAAFHAIGTRPPAFEQDLPETPGHQFLEEISVPVLFIQGEEDALVHAEYTLSVADRVPRAQTHFYEDCGHSPFLEEAHRFNRDVLHFLASLPWDHRR